MGYLSKRYLPEYAELRRDAYLDTQPYYEGIARDLDQLRLEHSKANGPEKRAIESIARHKMSGIDASKLPLTIQQFKQQIGD